MSVSRETKLAQIAESLAAITAELATLVPVAEEAEPAPQPEPIVEDAVQVTTPKVKIPKGHNYVVVSESDFIDDLTPNGRRLLASRATFESVDDAREFARFATERPIYVGEVVLDESSDAVYTRLKLSYQPDVS